MVDEWQKLIALARERGVGSCVAVIPENPKTPLYGAKLRAGDPSEANLSPLLPPEYRDFIAEVGYVAVDFGERAKLAFLPPRVMSQVTGAMGDGAMPFDETRALRKKGTYEWRFAFFAGWDFADVNGYCFQAERGALSVHRVEDSLPTGKSLGAFAPWLAKELARFTKIIETPAKAARVLRELRENEGLEDDEKLPALTIASFGA